MLTNISKSKIYEKHKTTNTPAKTPPEAYHFQLNVTAKEGNIKHGIGKKWVCSNNIKGSASVPRPPTVLLSDHSPQPRLFLLIEIPTQCELNTMQENKDGLWADYIKGHYSTFFLNSTLMAFASFNSTA